jgi:rubrerythrin
MARILGITTKKDTKGNITKVIIDVNKHREIIAPLLAQLTLTENETFEKEWAEAKSKSSSIEDVFGRLEAKIKSLEWQK